MIKLLPVMSLLFLMLCAIPSKAQHPPVDTTSAVDSSLNMAFSKAEMDASFPGGQGALLDYIKQNTDQKMLASRKAPAGKYTVYVQFLVDKNGNVSRIESLKKIGYGLEAEVIRLIKAGPRWIPGMQNGHAIKIWHLEKVLIEVL